MVRPPRPRPGRKGGKVMKDWRFWEKALFIASWTMIIVGALVFVVAVAAVLWAR